MLTWEFHHLDLVVLSDESHHGSRAIDFMKQLDSDRYVQLLGICTLASQDTPWNFKMLENVNCL